MHTPVGLSTLCVTCSLPDLLLPHAGSRCAASSATATASAASLCWRPKRRPAVSKSRSMRATAARRSSTNRSSGKQMTLLQLCWGMALQGLQMTNRQAQLPSLRPLWQQQQQARQAPAAGLPQGRTVLQAARKHPAAQPWQPSGPCTPAHVPVLRNRPPCWHCLAEMSGQPPSSAAPVVPAWHRSKRRRPAGSWACSWLCSSTACRQLRRQRQQQPAAPNPPQQQLQRLHRHRRASAWQPATRTAAWCCGMRPHRALRWRSASCARSLSWLWPCTPAPAAQPAAPAAQLRSRLWCSNLTTRPAHPRLASATKSSCESRALATRWCGQMASCWPLAAGTAECASTSIAAGGRSPFSRWAAAGW